MLTILLVVLLVMLLLGGLRAPGNYQNILWFLLVVVGVYFIIRLVT